MLAASVAASVAFSPAAGAAVVSRPAVRVEAPLMVEQPSSRRALFAKAGAALGLVAAQSASAKAGQFSKIEIFSIVGTPGISTPFQPGGPKAGPDATFGYAKSEGEMLAKDYKEDITREKAAFDVSAKIVRSQQANVDSKTWWLVRDNLRGQAYNMKANMLAVNTKAADPAAAKKAYKKFWSEIDQLDLACQKKELALAQKEYSDVLAALDEYSKLI